MRQLQLAATKMLFDELIDRHAEAYLNAYPEVKEFSTFERSGTINYYIGMVWTNNYERPDTQQLKIRGSHSLTRNKLVELDLSNVDGQHSFFPGQIIAFSADPFLRRQLSVRKFLDPIRIAPPMKKIDSDPIRLIIASGPYMKQDQEDWSIFEKIVECVKSNQASHVVLLGPFVDMENKHAKAQFPSYWQAITDTIVEALHDVECQVYLVPSSRDILPACLASSYFYPCPPISLKLRYNEGSSEPKCNIKAVGDPAQIDLGGIYLDATSAEVLFHMNKCTAFVNKGPGNLFTPLFRHLVEQGIYPIHPAPNDIAVDYRKLARHLQLDRLGPHIMVMPTRFNTSVVNVENRIVVAVHKSSIKRQVVMIDIPKIESSQDAPIDSIVLKDYTHKIIDLFVKKEPSEVNGQAAGESNGTSQANEDQLGQTVSMDSQAAIAPEVETDVALSGDE